MKTRVLGWGAWNRAEALTVLFLSVLLFLEMSVILLLNPDLGSTMVNVVSALASWSVAAIVHIWRYVWRMVGPVVFPLTALLAIEAIAVFRLYKHWKTGHWDWETTKIEWYFRSLEGVERVAPGFGFLGTCISLVATMSSMDPNLNQKAMLKALLVNSSSAFGSTICGISLAISAFVFGEIFKGFLLSTRPDIPPADHAMEKDPEPSSMSLLKTGG
jgi:cell division protein FtsW (lipid II flippase)